MEDKYQKNLETIRLYSKQLNQSWQEIQKINFPEEYKNVENVVFCGMGGSGLGERMVDSLYEREMKVPMELFSGYSLPRYASEKSLLILSSYSGNTEEIMACAKEAKERNTKVIGISTGGDLAKFLEEENYPNCVFEPKYNPSGQPRMALGYSAGSLLCILGKLNLIDFSEEKLNQALAGMKLGNNLEKATTFAKNLEEKIVLIIASEHLVGTAHAIKNMFNESAKTMAAFFDLPELNHYLMEGLAYPKSNKENLKFIFVESSLYGKRVQKRYPLTRDVVRKQDISYLEIKLRGETKMAQTFELLTLGSLMVYALTKIYGIDPIKIPWVDYFKKEMEK